MLTLGNHHQNSRMSQLSRMPSLIGRERINLSFRQDSKAIVQMVGSKRQYFDTIHEESEKNGTFLGFSGSQSSIASDRIWESDNDGWQQLVSPTQKSRVTMAYKSKRVTICEQLNEVVEPPMNQFEQIQDFYRSRLGQNNQQDRFEQKCEVRCNTSYQREAEINEQAACSVIRRDKQAGIRFKGQIIERMQSKKVQNKVKRKISKHRESQIIQNVPQVTKAKKIPVKKVQKPKVKKPKRTIDPVVKQDMKVKRDIRRFLENQVKNGELPEDNIVIEEYLTYLGSQKFRNTIKKKRAKDELDANPLPTDYTEQSFGNEAKIKCLQGLFTRQFHESYFQDPSSNKFVDLVKQIFEDLEIKNTSVRQNELINLLRYGQNQLFVLYDPRIPIPIRNSRNSQSVINSQSYHQTKIIGYVVFRECPTTEMGCVVVEKMEVRFYSKQNKRKTILAMDQVFERLRAKDMFLFSKPKHERLYQKLGFVTSDKSPTDLYDMGIEMKSNRTLMQKLTLLRNRDIKAKIWVDNQITLRKRAQKLQTNITEYSIWNEKNKDKFEEQLKKNYRPSAIKSDQAKTPKWIFVLVKLFTRLRDDQILDAFVYQERWNEKAFYNAFKRIWNPRHFYWVNPPFSQTVAALKKCADFQSNGGNCVMILPDISLTNSDLYKDYLQHTTIRVDLPLFAYDGYKDPLLKHCVLLYFLTPEFTSQLTSLKEVKIIEQNTYLNEDKSRVQVIHKPAVRKSGPIKRSFTSEQENVILKHYIQGESITHIAKIIQLSKVGIRKFLVEQLGESTVDHVQIAHARRTKAHEIASLIKGF